jgi:hypothetical protein
MLDREFHYYKAHENELVKQYNGKFIAIVGEQVVGVFDEEFTAYQEMKKKYGLGNFCFNTACPLPIDRSSVTVHG